MADSNSRLRNALALVRILTGVLFLFAGAHKIESWEFAKIQFPQFLWEATHGGAVDFYGDLLSGIGPHSSKAAAVVAFIELFIGVGLVLGLAVRPVSLVGVLYSLHLLLATWYLPGADEAAWRYLDNATRPLLVLFLFLLLGAGHAGESWGLGAIYHRRRRRRESQVGEQELVGSEYTSKSYSHFDVGAPHRAYRE